MSSQRELAVFMARVAEQSERYNDMVKYMKEVAKMNVELTVEERNLLSVAYKNVVGTRRASWRVVHALTQNQNSQEQLNALQSYKREIEKELTEVCDEITTLLEKHLIPACESDEAHVFHLKLLGDYHRYLAEFRFHDQKEEPAKNARAAYQNAQKYAAKLPSTHPIRLGLALNFSVFYYEIENDKHEAIAMATSAFDSAIEDLDTLTEESYKDSTLIMQLLKDNLSLWRNTHMGDDDAGEEDLEIQDP